MQLEKTLFFAFEELNNDMYTNHKLALYLKFDFKITKCKRKNVDL